MPALFSGGGTAATGTNITLGTLFDAAATPAGRAGLYEIILGCGAAPADIGGRFNLSRITALGTEGSGFTPTELDLAGPAAEYDYGVAHSAEPTYTASSALLQISMNQRATFRWVAAPGGHLVVPAVQNNGFGLRSIAMSSGVTAWEWTMHHMEYV